MSQPIACIFLNGSIDDWYLFPILLAFIAISFTSRYWRLIVQWMDGIRGQDWATISAVIDVVSIVEQKENGRYGEYVVGYLATLTCFYRNPELQMGEYSRTFDKEEDAKAWAASYKGRTVLVHVNPRDPSHSILRKETL